MFASNAFWWSYVYLFFCAFWSFQKNKLPNLNVSYTTLCDWCVINRWGPTWLSIYRRQRSINRSHTFCAVGLRRRRAMPVTLVSSHVFQTDSLLEAVDVRFETFFAFDINSTTQFLQQVLYHIDGHESSSVKFLRTTVCLASTYCRWSPRALPV